MAVVRNMPLPNALQTLRSCVAVHERTIFSQRCRQMPLANVFNA
jgi:hypothetical protein